jgi:hypothetical protein
MNESKEDIIIGLNNQIDDLNFMIEEQALLIKVKLIEKQRVKEAINKCNHKGINRDYLDKEELLKELELE